MLDYQTYYEIAQEVLSRLNIPEDIYLTWNNNDVREFNKKYLNDESYIRGLIDEVLAGYDTSENVPSDIEDIKENAFDEVFYALDDITENYYRHQEKVIMDVYKDVVEAIQNIDNPDIVDVDVEYEPADPEVGDYNEHRSITINLPNNAYISLEVDINY